LLIAVDGFEVLKLFAFDVVCNDEESVDAVDIRS
jgi:hypothetical protein